MLAANRGSKRQAQHSKKAIVDNVLPCCGFADMKDAAHLLDYALSKSPGVSLFIHGESLNVAPGLQPFSRQPSQNSYGYGIRKTQYSGHSILLGDVKSSIYVGLVLYTS